MRSRNEYREPTDEAGAVVGPVPGPDVDEAVLRDLVESEARKDAASGMYDENLGAHGHPLLMESKIDRWNHRWSAEAEMRQQDDQQSAALLVRRATSRHATEERTRDHLEHDVADACAYRDRMKRIVEGTEPGDDGGRWAAQSRIDENRRGEMIKDWAIYLGAAFAEVGLNYTAFQLMGSGLAETAVLAASIVLVNVLLPKQLGELLTRFRRTRRSRGVLLVGLVGGAALWVGVSVFVALVRSAYLLSFTGVQVGGESLLERAGLGWFVLTAGWLLVVLAVGSVVLLRSASRHNPYLKNLHAADARVAKLRCAVAAKHGEVVAATLDVERARGSEADLAEHWAGKRAEQDGFAAELKHHYQHHLARDLANPTFTDGVEITASRAPLPPPSYRPERGD
ncbi:MAG: hypothetical protein GEV09_00260 [Pseudonocardiaceae bacterium]|nr:hypothetical protein [Pseudonocardiaceae bacterium]